MELYVFILLALGLWIYNVLTFRGGNDDYKVMKTNRGDENPVAAAISRGYSEVIKTTGRPFWVQYWQQNYLILPAKYLPDVRRAERDHLSFVGSIADILFLYNWIGDLFKSSRMVFAVIKGVNPQLPKLSKTIFEESEFAFAKAIPIKDGETTTLNANDFLISVTLRTMARVVAGTGLSRDEEFLKAAKAYFDGNFLTGFVMLNLPFRGRFRDLITWPLHKYHQHFRQQRVINMIKPLVERRIEEHELGVKGQEFDTIQVTLNLANDLPFENQSRKSPTHLLAHETLQLIWASGQSPAISATSILFKLLESPEYIEPLRDEAQVAVDKYGWTDPIFNELPKLDSFIREVHRTHSTFALNATRQVQNKPFVCSDGLQIPVGTRIAFAAEACQLDADFTKDPLQFDGFRFVKLAKEDARQEDGVSRWAATHAGFSNLTFGYGNHACPGRFIAVRLLKAMLARLLLDYDISWDRQREPPRFAVEGMSFPNYSQEFTVEKRASRTKADTSLTV